MPPDHAAHALHALYSPHAVCYLWDWRLILLQGGTDLATGLAYVGISIVALFIFRAGGFRTLAAAFPLLWVLGASFVGLCGVNHLLAAVEILWPIYWLSGVERLGMAVVSVTFAIILWRRRVDLALVGRVLGETARQLRVGQLRNRHITATPGSKLPK